MENSSAGKTYKKQSEWGFRPLVNVMKIAGIDLHPSSNLISRFLITSFGISLVAYNIRINRPKLDKVFKRNSDDIAKGDDYSFFADNPSLYLLTDPNGIVKLVRFAFNSICFYYPCIIYICFVTFLLFFNKQLRFIHNVLKQFDKQMNSGTFYRKCRNNCVIAILFLILVAYIRLFLPIVTLL